MSKNTTSNSTLIDIVIPIKTSKLLFAINYTIPSILSKLSFNKLYILTKKENFDTITSAFANRIVCIDENKICEGLSIDTLKDYFINRNANVNRVGWYFQQFLKLGIAKQDYILDTYLIWDADTIILKPLDFFTADYKIYYDITDEHHNPYFNSIKKLIGIEKQVDYSFITEHLLFKKEIVLNLIDTFSTPTKKWWFTILDTIDTGNLSLSGFSEYELYGNYVIKNHPNEYQLRQLKKYRNGTKLFGNKPSKNSLKLFSHVFDYITFEEWQKKQKITIIRYLKIASVFIKTLF